MNHHMYFECIPCVILAICNIIGYSYTNYCLNRVKYYVLYLSKYIFEYDIIYELNTLFWIKNMSV